MCKVDSGQALMVIAEGAVIVDTCYPREVLL